MKKAALLLIVLLLLGRSWGQDYRILQKDKNKIFVSITRSSDSLVQIVAIHADWRLDYYEKNIPYRIRTVEYTEVPDSASRPKHKYAHIASLTDIHHSREQLTRSFYMDISAMPTVNEIFRSINNEYRNVMQIDDQDYSLIRNLLPDSAAEYYVDGYKGANTAALDVVYTWGAPMRDWSVAFALSIHDIEAKKVLSSILCMGPNETELTARKIRIRQANLLAVMSYSDMFCQ